jgi:hypothetical protein
MKTADCHLNVFLAKLPRQVNGPGKLVRLDPYKGYEPMAAIPENSPGKVLDLDPRIGLVIRTQLDIHIFSQHLVLDAIETKAVNGGHGVGGDRGFVPLNNISVIIVMRRFDHDQFEFSFHGSILEDVKIKNCPDFIIDFLFLS